MEGRKISKIFCLVGIFGLAIGLATFAVGLVLILRNNEVNPTEVPETSETPETSDAPEIEDGSKFLE